MGRSHPETKPSEQRNAPLDTVLDPPPRDGLALEYPLREVDQQLLDNDQTVLDERAAGRAPTAPTSTRTMPTHMDASAVKPRPAVLDRLDPPWRRSCEDGDSGVAKEG